MFSVPEEETIPPVTLHEVGDHEGSLELFPEDQEIGRNLEVEVLYNCYVVK